MSDGWVFMYRLGNQRMVDTLNIPIEFRTQVKQVFDDWLRICDETPSEETFHNEFVSRLQQLGYLEVSINDLYPALLVNYSQSSYKLILEENRS